MESKPQRYQACRSPFPDPPPSLLKDISNFNTPKRTSQNPNFHSPYQKFITASKDTPRSSSSAIRKSHRTSIARSKAARRLKAFELEQSKSARKAQISREKSLKSLEKSLAVWLNFLFENPQSCGVEISRFNGENWPKQLDEASTSRKRDSWSQGEVGVDGPWRGPKRPRDLSWSNDNDAEIVSFPNSIFSSLQCSLKEICSFEDLRERMSRYFSLSSCKEIFVVMTQLTKTIDDGRLKMKSHCPIVSDVGMKEKARKILMCYNPIWLRFGLYMVFGGEALLSNEDANSEQEIAFLKMVIEKQFFSHTGLAKAYAYNKLVEGLYRPGYFDKLGTVLLKRFLLLVLILDRAKSQSSLPIKYGIDGWDGGSPLLFNVHSNIKSSRQLINDFLQSDLMHGEGNLLAHLVAVGYKVSYQQSPLAEFDFRVTDLVEDLKDGIRLCRAIQLLQHDSSILMKMLVPSDTRKKNLINSGVAMQYLKQAGVPLHDEQGTMILGEDVVNGDKELVLSLLWNMFVHLQLPLLINKAHLSEEITRIRGVTMEYSHNYTLLDMLLSWIQAICESYGFLVESFSSLVDGKAMWCLLDHYFHKERHCTSSFKDPSVTNEEVSIVSAAEYTDAVHNFILSQKLTLLLGNFPEVLQVSDILEHNCACNERGVIILLVFLSFQLVVKRNTGQLNFHKLLGINYHSPERRLTERWFMQSEPTLHREELLRKSNEDIARNFKTIMAWWHDMARRNSTRGMKPACPLRRFSTDRQSIHFQRENAAKVIQSNFRRLIESRKYMLVKRAVTILHTVIRAWLITKKAAIRKSSNRVQEPIFGSWKNSEVLERYVTFMMERLDYVKLRRSALIIQHAARTWISRRHFRECISASHKCPFDLKSPVIHQEGIHGRTDKSRYSHCATRPEKASNIFEENDRHDLQIKSAFEVQPSMKKVVAYSTSRNQHLAATIIQSHCRGWLLRESFVKQKKAVVNIQSTIRSFRIWRNFQRFKLATRSATIIQSHARRLTAERRAYRYRCLILKLQSYFRVWLTRRKFLIKKEAVIRIQSISRRIKCQKAFHFYKHAAIEIQRFLRGWIVRKKLLGIIFYHKSIMMHYNCSDTYGFFRNLEVNLFVYSVLKLQRWWRGILSLRCKAKSAIVIQSHIRGWIARQVFAIMRHHVVVIQSYCRGWSTRRSLHFQREAVITFQSVCRRIKFQKEFHCYRQAAIEVQQFVRGCIARKRLLGSSLHHKAMIMGCNCGTSYGFGQSPELRIFICSVLRLQSWWRAVLSLRCKTKSAIIIQSHIRGWIARKLATTQRHRVAVIQSYWKGYLARKNSRGELQDLCLRVQKSAVNVDDSMRIINRLVAALSELLSMKSVSGILHICATLDMATKHSLKCCEELAAAGAVGTLLKLIRSVSRSIPDQEVLKHALSTLRNLARYPHLTELLIHSRGSLETIFLEFFRNKEDGYFIASELLKKICTNQEGVEAIRKTPGLLKRLCSLVENLTRQAVNEKRNVRAMAGRDQTERRLQEAVELFKLITNG